MQQLYRGDLQNMKQNREALVEKLLTENYELYYRLAYSYVHNEADAMDIVQEGAYKAILKCESLERADFAGSWIYRIMLNEIYRMLRRKHDGQNLSSEEALDAVPDSMQIAEEVTDSLTLKEALDCLSPEDKMLVQLRYFEDLKLEQIAEILDANLNTVKSRLYRTLKKLRLHLEEE